MILPAGVAPEASTSARKFRKIMTPQLSIRVLPSEVPLDGPLFGISRLLPGINFGLQKFSTGNASIQALAGEDANFDLGHIQPAYRNVLGVDLPGLAEMQRPTRLDLTKTEESQSPKIHRVLDHCERGQS